MKAELAKFKAELLSRPGNAAKLQKTVKGESSAPAIEAMLHLASDSQAHKPQLALRVEAVIRDQLDLVIAQVAIVLVTAGATGCLVFETPSQGVRCLRRFSFWET